MRDVTIPPVRPLLHPVLVLRKEAAEKEVSRGGKKESDIVTERLASQRLALADEVSNLRASSSRLNSFSGDILLVCRLRIGGTCSGFGNAVLGIVVSVSY
jgi:hypothetical protein